MPHAANALLLALTVFLAVVSERVSADVMINVQDAVTVTVTGKKPGEISAVVIPPGKKTQCLAGRVLIANDDLAPADNTNSVSGIVTGMNLDGTPMPASKHNAIPVHPEKYSHSKSADKNMVSLPNGDIVYQTQSFSTTALPAKDIAGFDVDASWFDVTYRLPDVGPGARTVEATWLSTDCGETFNYVGEADPVVFSRRGECAYPQGAGQMKDGKLIYDMGGSDGTWLGVDRAGNRLILLYQCVGEFPVGKVPMPKFVLKGQPRKCPDGTPNTPDHAQFKLSGCPLDKTYVLTSSLTDPGKTWTPLGVVDPPRMWRPIAVPLPQDKLAIGFGVSVYLGSKSASGITSFTRCDIPGETYGYDAAKFPSADIAKSSQNPNLVGAGIQATSILARAPGETGKVLLVVPSTFKNTHGYKVFTVDPVNAQDPGKCAFTPRGEILPAGKTAGDVIMHLAAIDPGQGPILLYWYDVSTVDKKATIRGRLLVGKDEDIDRDISKVNGATNAFELRPAGSTAAHPFRDYKQAEGYTVPRPPGSSLLLPSKYEFFPAWVQPGPTLHFARVSVSVPMLTVDKSKIGKASPITQKLTLRWRAIARTPLTHPRPVTPQMMKNIQQHNVERGR